MDDVDYDIDNEDICGVGEDGEDVLEWEWEYTLELNKDIFQLLLICSYL